MDPIRDFAGLGEVNWLRTYTSFLLSVGEKLDVHDQWVLGLLGALGIDGLCGKRTSFQKTA